MPSTLPFHADQIGSLIRPAALAEAQAKADAGTISASELQSVQRSAIATIVKQQQDHGVRALSSGEFDRKYYFSGFFEKLNGFHEVSPVPWDLARQSAPPVAALKKAGKPYMMAAICDAKMSYTESPYLENWKMLRDTLPEDQWAQCKFTMPPPCYFHLRLDKGKCYSADAYANDDDFFADLALMYQKEFKTLYDNGCRNIQIDDPTLAYFCSDDMLESLKKEGEDPDKLFETYLKAHNDAIANRPADLHVGLHVCRGKFLPHPPPCYASKRASEQASKQASKHRCTDDLQATSPSRCTSAKVPTRRLPAASSPRSTTTPSSSSTTTPAPAASSPCASCPRTRTWC
jgi:methionine synthase II (cobalamin-independent)